MKSRSVWYLFFLLFCVSTQAAAQAVAICPPPELLDFARSSSACFQLGRNEACFGNGAVNATFQDSVEPSSFKQAGDIVPLDHLRSITLSPVEDDVAIATLAVQASLPDAEANSMFFLLFGDVRIFNSVDYLAEVSAIAKGTLTIRKTPDTNSEIITQLGVNSGVIATGRTADGKWLRVSLPDAQAMGWVATDLVSTLHTLSVLSVVEPTTPLYKPFQVLVIETHDAALCGGQSAGGLLMQTPNVKESASITINGVDVRLAGTAYLQTLESGYLSINLLDGEAEITVGSQMTFVPAGSQVRISIDPETHLAAGQAVQAEPYDGTQFAGLPLNNLPARIQLVDALTPEQISSLTDGHTNQSPVTITRLTPEPSTVCRYFTSGTATLLAGPGEFYEAINEIQSNARVYPVLQIKDADGNIWWQLNNSNWIRANAVSQLGECVDIPLTDVVPPQPYNILSMETCKTQNGPLRVGQNVTIEFKPPAFENYYDASIALQVDPGQIAIDERYQRVNASAPISIGTAGSDQERYVRVFSTQWKATGGTHKIISERLSYILTCNVTVPFG